MSVIRGGLITISASSPKVTPGNTASVQFPGSPESVQFILNVTAASSPTTLDVYLQHSLDAGTTWYDFGHFAQVGAVSTSTQSLSWTRRSAALNVANTAVTATGNAALAAGTVINGPVCDQYVRARWVIAGISYTFSLVAIYDRD